MCWFFGEIRFQRDLPENEYFAKNVQKFYFGDVKNRAEKNERKIKRKNIVYLIEVKKKNYNSATWDALINFQLKRFQLFCFHFEQNMHRHLLCFVFVWSKACVCMCYWVQIVNQKRFTSAFSMYENEAKRMLHNDFIEISKRFSILCSTKFKYSPEYIFIQ